MRMCPRSPIVKTVERFFRALLVEKKLKQRLRQIIVIESVKTYKYSEFCSHYLNYIDSKYMGEYMQVMCAGDTAIHKNNKRHMNETARQ